MKLSSSKATLARMIDIRKSNNLSIANHEYYVKYSTSQLRNIKNSLYIPNKKKLNIIKYVAQYVMYYNNIYNRNEIQREIEARKICINYCVMNNDIIYENYLT